MEIIIPTHKRTIFLRDYGNIFVQFPKLRMKFYQSTQKNIFLYVYSYYARKNFSSINVRIVSSGRRIRLNRLWPVCLGNQNFRGKLDAVKAKKIVNKFFNSKFIYFSI